MHLNCCLCQLSSDQILRQAYLGEFKNCALGQIGKFFGGTANQHGKFGKFRKFWGDKLFQKILGGAMTVKAYSIMLLCINQGGCSDQLKIQEGYFCKG